MRELTPPPPMRRRLPLLVLLALAGCTGPRPTPGAPAPNARTTTGGDLRARAEALAQRALIVDGHIDLPYRLTEDFEDPATRTLRGDFDYERARAGGLDAPFMSIYIPAARAQPAAYALADSLIDAVERLVARAPDRFEIARSPADVARIARAGKVALPMGMENGSPIGSLDDMRHFARRGIRYVTLTHGKNNRLGDSSYDTTRAWGGLSPFGREVVAEMNRLGVLVDVSHVSDSTALQAIRASRAPVIASHSSMRAFTPGWERNMSDDVLRALAARGGVVMINFGSAFLRGDYLPAQTQLQLRLNNTLRGRGLTSRSPEAVAFLDAQRKANPVGTLADVVAHVQHAVRVGGIDHVGLGSDFDGVFALPAGLQDVSMYPNLVEALLAAGFSEADVEKILGGNVLRVWREAERVAG